MADFHAMQRAMREMGLDGWLFCDFRGSDPLAYSILGLPRAHATRRWFYFVPVLGEAVRVVHAIEPGVLDGLPGVKRVYLAWTTLRETLRATLANTRRVAMQFSPLNNIPYVSRVDAGTIDLIRSFGVEVMSSADLVQQFEAVMTPAQLGTHLRAGETLGALVTAAFAEVGARLRAGQVVTEHGIQAMLVEGLESAGLITDHPPIVAVNANSANPHYAPSADAPVAMRSGDFLLIDLWAKEKTPDAIFADITWTAFLGANPSARHLEIFDIVRSARDAGVSHVRESLAAGQAPRGCDVDDAVRAVIQRAGYGERFIHRTGHSIHTQGHGNGANLDNLETRDERRLLPMTVFSIEPGIYLEGDFGVRSEINVYLADARTAVVSPPAAQTALLCVDC